MLISDLRLMSWELSYRMDSWRSVRCFRAFSCYITALMVPWSDWRTSLSKVAILVSNSAVCRMMSCSFFWIWLSSASISCFFVCRLSSTRKISFCFYK